MAASRVPLPGSLGSPVPNLCLGAPGEGVPCHAMLYHAVPCHAMPGRSSTRCAEAQRCHVCAERQPRRWLGSVAPRPAVSCLPSEWWGRAPAPCCPEPVLALLGPPYNLPPQSQCGVAWWTPSSCCPPPLAITTAPRVPWGQQCSMPSRGSVPAALSRWGPLHPRGAHPTVLALQCPPADGAMLGALGTGCLGCPARKDVCREHEGCSPPACPLCPPGAPRPG